MSRIPKTAQVGASSPLIAAILRQMRFLKTTGMRGAELRSWNGHDLDFGLNVKHSPRNAIERITLGRGLAARVAAAQRKVACPARRDQPGRRFHPNIMDFLISRTIPGTVL
jgi:hypothetical protein